MCEQMVRVIESTFITEKTVSVQYKCTVNCEQCLGLLSGDCTAGTAIARDAVPIEHEH